MKLKPMMCIKIYLKTNIYSTTVIMQLTAQSSTNRTKLIEKFKDETCVNSITGLVGLRAKMYSYMTQNHYNGKTAKGIKKYISLINKQVSHANYKGTLMNNKQLFHVHEMNKIRSEKDELGSFKLNKVSLSCFDNKRYILDDGISSLAYGHKYIRILDNTVRSTVSKADTKGK